MLLLISYHCKIKKYALLGKKTFLILFHWKRILQSVQEHIIMYKRTQSNFYDEIKPE